MSTISLTPAGGWYADPLDAAQLRWWDGVTWTGRTTAASAAAELAAFAAAPAAAAVAPAPAEPAPAEPAPAVSAPAVSMPFAPVAPDPALYGWPPAAPPTPWPAAGTYQPLAGPSVTFDPNTIRPGDLVPMIPPRPRDAGARATATPNSRPDLQWYRSAPLGPSSSTYTGGLVMIVLTPLLMSGGYALLLRLTSLNAGLAPRLAVALLLVVLFFVGIGAAQVDRNALAQRGYFDLASPFWILLSPLVYLGVRASRLRLQGSGGIRVLLLWILAWAAGGAILVLSTSTAMTA